MKFPNFFGGGKKEQPLDRVVVNPSPEITLKKVEKEFTMGDFIFEEVSGRKILCIPIGLLNKIGGRDVLGRKIFPKQFNGSWSAWGQLSEKGYAVELPSDVTAEQVEDFKALILNWRND